MNERNEIWIEHGGQPVVCRQIVGILARRIVCRLKAGDQVDAGQRFGVMKFGSRMDFFLPLDRAIAVKVGDRVVGPVRRRSQHWSRSVGDRASSPRLRSAPRPTRAPRPAARRVLLPSLFTLAQHVLRLGLRRFTPCAASYATAAPFIGFAIVLDMLDGRIARMTGTAERLRRRVRLAGRRHLVRHRAGHPAFAWGLSPLGRLGWAAGFLFVTAAALRLARFNIQTAVGDKRYFVGMPSPAAAGVPAATVFFFPTACTITRRRCAGAGDGARAGAADGQHDPLPQLQDDRPPDAARLPGC